MSIKVQCKECGKVLNAPDKFIGKVGKCKCGAKIKIVAESAPAAPEEETPVTSPAPEEAQSKDNPESPAPKTKNKKLPFKAKAKAASGRAGKMSKLKGKIPPASSRRNKRGKGTGTGSRRERTQNSGRRSRGEKDNNKKEKQPAIPLEGAVAGLFGRLIAMILDTIIVSALCIGIMFALGGSAVMEGITSLKKTVISGGSVETANAPAQNKTAPAEKENNAAPKDNTDKTNSSSQQQKAKKTIVQIMQGLMTALIAALSIFLLYPIILEGFVGGTLGKLIFKLRVSKQDKTKAGILKAIIRNIVKFILGPISMICALFISQHRALHDLAAGTIIIKLGAVEEDEDSEEEEEDEEDDDDDDDDGEEEDYESDKDEDNEEEEEED